MNKHKTVLSKRMIISEGEKEKTNKQTVLSHTHLCITTELFKSASDRV